jgi:hypothetical protein
MKPFVTLVLLINDSWKEDIQTQRKEAKQKTLKMKR